MSKITYTLLLVALISVSGCSGVEGSAEKVFGNANDAISSSSNQVIWKDGSTNKGEGAEHTAGKVLDNANDAIKSSKDQILWKNNTEAKKETKE